MSDLVPKGSLTPEQLKLIKATVAKGATDDELGLFLYRAKEMGLDPLKPGMVHFVKYGSGPGTIIIGIEGFRAKAAATGLHTGTKRGVLIDSKGDLYGGWCEVYRRDWTEPAREEVLLSEYSTGKNQWVKMPGTMIKKVAEVAALRIAFPDQLGGLYSHEEMDQASNAKPVNQHYNHNPDTNTQTATDVVNQPEKKLIPLPPVPQGNVGDHVIKIGKKFKGMKISDLKFFELEEFVMWVRTKSDQKFRESEPAQEFLFYAEEYLKQSDEGNRLDEFLNASTPSFDDKEVIS